MNTFDWIVCERSNGWAAAVRTALARQPGPTECAATLCEVRRLDELTVHLQQRPNSLALIEVTPTNLDAALTWLADGIRRSRQAKVVALLDRSFVSALEAASALREAGAMEIAQSPRQLQHVLQFARCYSSKRRMGLGQSGADQSIEEWAWALLPWQEAERPLG
ncbi:MAG: hypothetical protein L0228_06440 [Planctomycetes bacterium]|nr:hypothetical protein [Planctomycetota bacterium]